MWEENVETVRRVYKEVTARASKPLGCRSSRSTAFDERAGSDADRQPSALSSVALAEKSLELVGKPRCRRDEASSAGYDQAVAVGATSAGTAVSRIAIQLRSGLTGHAPAACAGLAGAGCAENSPLDRPSSLEELQAADQVVREYLIAAAADDGRRLCSLRTVRGVRRLSGRSRCERRLAGSAFDGGREPEAVERGDVEVLPSDTHDASGHIVVFADAGEATLKAGVRRGGRW
jgi:hypothetical protein